MGTQKASGGGGKGASDVRAGGGYWELNLRDNLSKALDKIQARVKAFAANLSKIGGAGLGAGAALGAGPLGLLLGGGSRLADTARMARQFQVPIELMGKFQEAAERAGVSVDEVMGDTKGRFSDLVNQASPVDPEQAKAALKIQTDFAKAVRALQDALTPLLTSIAPVVSEVAKFAKENAGAVKILGGVALAVGGVGAALTVAGPVVAALGTGLGLIGTAAAAVLSPVGLVAAAVGGLGYAFVTQTDAGQKLFAEAKAGFAEVAAVGKTAWTGIADALKAGDLSAAWEVVLQTLKVGWAGAILFFETNWSRFKGLFVDGFRDVVAGVKLLFWDAMAWIAKQFSGVITKMVSGAAGLLDAVGLDGLSGKLKALDFSDANIDRNRDAIKGGIVADRQAAQREADAARAADVNGARQRLEDAKAALNALVARGPAGGLDKFHTDDEMDRFNKYGLPQAGKAFDEIKGGFNASAAAGQFGYGSKAGEQTELMKQQLGAVKELPKKIGDEVANGMIARFLLK
ncbi:hypothetical protein [Gemmata sp.]|uniref:hypothetical protein n=1 Tax=Gemmata sp. TaxID=1914242 RepID=UPI003F72FFA5